MTSTASSSAQAARQALADRLRDLMKSGGLSARGLSRRAGWHETKTSRILHTTQRPSEADLQAWCAACDSPDSLPELLAQLRSVDTMWLDWRRTERHGLLKLNRDVRDLYERTKLFRIYSSVMVPGPVQTAEYVRAVLTSIRARRAVAIDDVEASVAERMARQHIVYEGGHRFCVVLEESALRMQIGGPHVLAGQLRHLLAVQPLPSMALGVIPADVDRSLQWPVEMFFMFDRAQVSVELVSGFLNITAAHEVAMYERNFAELSQTAVFGPPARALIEQALAEVE